MRVFKEKRRIRKIIFSKMSLVVLFIIVVLLARAVWGILQKERIVSEKREQVVSELLELETRKNVLEEEISRLLTQRGIEEEIRSKFQLSKPNEKVVIIVDQEATTSTEDTESHNQSFWSRLGAWVLFWRD